MEATSNRRLACSGVGRLRVWARAMAVRDRRMRPSGFTMCSRLFSASEFLRNYKQTSPPQLTRAIRKDEKRRKGRSEAEICTNEARRIGRPLARPIHLVGSKQKS